MKSKILLFAFVTCITAAATAQLAFGQIPVIDSSQAGRGYLIGPGDVLKISVLDEEQFNVPQATVDEDGRIYIPFSEEGVTAKCRTEKQLKTDITELLKKYLKNPQVSVNVLERKSRPPAIVFGEIRSPQKIELTRKARLLDLISVSGGVTEDAGGIIQVYRTQPPLCEVEADPNWTVVDASKQDSEYVPSRMYSYSGLSKGSDKANPLIYPGDVIVVHKALPVYITGEVKSAQGVLIKEGGLTLTEALAKIGGINPTAKKKDIKIYRLKPDSKERETISANYDLIKKREQPDPILEPYDIIEVDKSKKSIAEIALELISGASRTALQTFSSGVPARIIY
jgi:polysaccharide biosynthesis/export protein